MDTRHTDANVGREVGVLKTARWNGRREVEFRNGNKRNVMVSKLELIHHGREAQVR